MNETTRLRLPLLAAAQAQKHVTHNEALLGLDALAQIGCLDRDLPIPPGSPGEGARYIVGPGAAGAWAGRTGQLAEWRDGVWRFTVPGLGFTAYLADEAILLVHDGADWRTAGTRLGAIQTARLGIGTQADPANPLSARLNTALLTALPAGEGGSGDLRLVMNKEGTSRTASVLLQSGYSGRAEIGLAGDDDLHVKVSGDGGSWTEALRVKPGGFVAIGGAAAPERLTVAGNIAPAADNTHSLGTPSRRFSAVWSATGTISTSDLRRKRDVAPLDGIASTRLLRAAPPVSYRWAADGPQGARHFGWSAQGWSEALAGESASDGLVVGTPDGHDPMGLRTEQILALQHAALLVLLDRMERLEARADA